MCNREKKSRDGNKNEPMKYWFVEITLTSGENLQFYVSAKDQFSAYQKADDYSKLSDSNELRKCYTGFKLLP